MNNFFIQQNDQLFCKSHGQPIEYLSKTKDLPIQDILLCDACYRGKQQKTKNTVSIQQIYDLINLQFDKNNKVLIKQKDILIMKFDLIHKNMNEIWQKINKEFDDKLKEIEKTNKTIKQFCSKPQNYDLLQKIEEIKENNFIFDPFDNLNTISSNHQKQIALFFKNLIQLFLEVSNIFKDFKLLRQKQSELEIKKIKSEQPIKDYVELKDKQQSENNLVRAIAFTAKGSEMIAGSGKNIQIWKYSNGGLQKDVLLKGHQSEINALVVSKKEQWFASGSIDGSILTWKQQVNQQWSNNKQQTSHQYYVTCLILNKDEDELLSSGQDKKIKVWQVNCQNNQILLKYDLNAKYFVNWMTLNKSQSKLITFNMSSIILLWIKKDQWDGSQYLKIEDQCLKGCFIGENEFVMQTKTTDCLRIYSVADFQFTLLSEYNLQGACQCDDSLFRSIVNKGRQILVHRCGKLIYFIKIQKEKLEKKIQIECEDEKNLGILTKNDDYFILWSQSISSFRIFKINYGP